MADPYLNCREADMCPFYPRLALSVVHPFTPFRPPAANFFPLITQEQSHFGCHTFTPAIRSP